MTDEAESVGGAPSLRLADGEIEPVAPMVEFTFAGERLAGREGESLAAALTAAGRLALGTRRDGSARGIFCGMGVCQECLVTIDGTPGLRACMSALRAGMRVEPGAYAANFPPRRGVGTGATIEPAEASIRDKRHPVPENSARFVEGWPDRAQAAPVSPAAPVPTPALPSGEGELREPRESWRVRRPLVHEPEILIVGGGPAGLAAARAAALCGAEVALLDERPSLGGQYFKQLAKTHRFRSDAAGDRQFRRGRALIAEVKRLGASLWLGASVWGAFQPRELAVLAADGSRHVFRPRGLILATGAYERGVPVPGWTLPGIMTTGAAQTLQRAYRVAPGRHVLIAGNGPLNFQLAAELARAGLPPLAVVEAAPRPGIGQAGALARAFARSPELMRDGLAYLARLHRARVPVLYGSALVSAHGEDRVKTAVVARIDEAGRPLPGTERRFEVDAICVGHGLVPSTEIARALGCRHRYDLVAGALLPQRDADGLTSADGIYVAGDCADIDGARVALEQGFIAGLAAALSLGRKPGPALAAELAARRKRLAGHRAFQRALWQVFRAPPLVHQLADPQTAICRCEDVNLAAVTRALAEGGPSLAGVKRRTRAGMGRCQGRACMPLLAALSAEAGAELGELALPAPQPPIRPVRIAALAEEPPP